MKKLYLLTTIAILFCNSLYSQWAPIGAKWIYENTPGYMPVLTIIESIRDTTILTKQCKVLKTSEIDNVEDSTGHYYYDTLYYPLQYLYNDSSIVYLYDNILNNFDTLYNFNAVKGDTITVRDSTLGHPENLFQYKVDSIGDTIIHGINLRKQFISATQNSGWFFYFNSGPEAYKQYPIIERIGSLVYLYGLNQVVMEGGIGCLRCYSDSNIFYHSPTWTDTLDCAYPIITNIKETENLQGNIKVFPNPANDFITFESSSLFYKKPINIKIYNAIGDVVKTLIFSDEKIEYRMNTFNLNGFYYYVVSDNGILLKSGTFIITH